jgi:hypothetical protein
MVAAKKRTLNIVTRFEVTYRSDRADLSEFQMMLGKPMTCGYILNRIDIAECKEIGTYVDRESKILKKIKLRLFVVPIGCLTPVQKYIMLTGIIAYNLRVFCKERGAELHTYMKQVRQDFTIKSKGRKNVT